MANTLPESVVEETSLQTGRLTWTDVFSGLGVAILFIVFLGEPQPVDPMIYLEGATSIGSVPAEHRSTRLGVILPTWAASQVFGYSELTFYFLPVLSGFLLGASLSYTGRQLYGRWVGLGAAALAATSPFILPFGSQLLPDVPSTAALVAALGLGLAAQKTDGTRRVTLLVGAGVATGLAYLFRETAVLFYPALIGALAVAGLRLRGLLVLFGTALYAPIVDVLAGVAVWGDPIARIRSVVERSATPPEITIEAAARAFSAQENPIETMALLLELSSRSAIGLILLALTAAYVIHAAADRDSGRRLLWVLPAWTLLGWLAYGIIGSIQPESGRPVLRLILGRYWAPFVPALALMAVAWVDRAGRSRWSILRRYSPYVLLLSVVVVASLGAIHNLDRFRSWFINFGSDSYQELREEISDIPAGATVRIPDRIDPVLRLYFNDPFGRRVADLDVRSDSPPPGEGLDDWFLFHAEGEIPEAPTDQRRSWPRASAVAASRVAGSLRWVLFAPQSAVLEQEREVVEHDGSGSDGWRMRVIEDSVWSGEMPVPSLMRLEDDVDAVLYDSSAFYGKPPVEGEVVRSGELTEVRIGVDAVDGIFSVDCQYFPLAEPQERVSRRAVTMRHPSPFWGDVVGLCVTPTEHQSYLFRPVLIARGPALFRMEGSLVTAVLVEELDD